MKIRGHHLLCILHFEGKGYSQEFVENMRLIKERLENNEKFLLFIGEDDICIKCPYFKERCLRESKVGEIEEKDKNIIGLLGLEKNKEYSWDYINKIIFVKMNAKIFKDLCEDCSWYYLCSKRNLFLS
ncbi:MAG: DUF1284 domain-containing protein [Dictyoglomaceae bacterium]|nr:DUF1284 domain-containing protein [Dictyoglomaceae bacterium]